MPPVYYPAVIDRSSAGYGISFPDFPGCIAAGDTVQEAAVNGEAVLALHLDGLRETGDSIPAPSSLDAIEDIEGAEDVARVLVRASMPAKFSRIQVTLEDSLLAAIDAVAPNRSGFLAEAARASLRSSAGEQAAARMSKRDLVEHAAKGRPPRNKVERAAEGR